MTVPDDGYQRCFDWVLSTKFAALGLVSLVTVGVACAVSNDVNFVGGAVEFKLRLILLSVTRPVVVSRVWAQT
jgi:hypothetical protein